MDLYSPSTTVVSGVTALIKFLSSVTALEHRVIAERITFEGDAWLDKQIKVVNNGDALVNSARVEALTTGTLGKVGNGTALTWGGEV